MQALKQYCLEIIQAIEDRKVSSTQQLNKLKNVLCEKYKIAQAPTNATILSFAAANKERVLKVLEMKPVKSLSGIVAVAVMPKPQKCPGKCIYCPNSLVDEETPKSYTGREPATMRALQAGFNARKQIQGRIQQLQEMGHNAEKVELIIMGGTFPAAPYNFQKKFMLECFNSVNLKKTQSLETAKLFKPKANFPTLQRQSLCEALQNQRFCHEVFCKAKKLAEKAKHRIVGITFETRPDYCGKKEINRILEFGGTRVELGVQTVQDDVLRKINRKHSAKQVSEATQLLKDSALKVGYHLMPGLPFSNYKKELKAFRKVFSSQDFKPDMLKIYPCLVIKGTKLYGLWKKGKFEPFDTEKAVKFLTEAKACLPKWVRVMRIQRDIPTQLIEAGVKSSNIRQIVHERLKEEGLKCSCIRCREIGLLEYLQNEKPNFESLKTKRIDYNASNGKEIFLSMEDHKENLYGFLRLRNPFNPFRKELKNSALVRELHVLGQALALGEQKEGKVQHLAIGKQLLQEAERISKDEFDFKEISVISGVGAKEYYRKQGYCNDGAFVSKRLSKTN